MNVSFNPPKAYRRRNGVPRQWLTFYSPKNALFCSVCLAFTKPSEDNTFVSGMSTWTLTYQRIEENENSIGHGNCAEAYDAYTWI